jgi:hypothetical protein
MNRLLRRTFRLQYASNLFVYREAMATHEEMLKPGVAPYLALLGNCVNMATREGRWKSQEFLSFCATNWKRTLLVPATTELACGGHAWTDALDDLRGLVDEVNKDGFPGEVVVGDQAVLEFPEGVRVLGFTGWSAWSRQVTSPPSLGFPTLHCYGVKGSRPFIPSDGHGLSREDMEWLNRELLVDGRTPTVLLSHGLPSAALLPKEGAGAQSDLMSVYPFGFLFQRERCIKAAIGGALGGAMSGVFNGRFLAVNARRPYPAAPYWANPSFRRDAFWEYSWLDDTRGDVEELVEAYSRAIPLPYRVTKPNAPSVC